MMNTEVKKKAKRRAEAGIANERRSRGLVLAAIAVTAAVAIVSLGLFIKTASGLRRGAPEDERTDIPVLIGNINNNGGAEQLYGGEPCAVRQVLPNDAVLLARNGR